ncbi:MAG: hypothetical protein ACXVBW_14370, partial [Bdellovibrionota bacterium]
NAQLKKAISDSQSKLGTLDPFQTQIFNDEVVPQYQRFIRDYRPTPSGLSADIDTDSIRRYLLFQATKSLKQKEYRFLVALKMDPNCEKCRESFEGIKRLVNNRIVRRGLQPAWLSPEDVADPKLVGKALDDWLADVAARKNFAGAVAVQWNPAPIDDIDTAHADEKRYIIHAFLDVREISKSGGQLELMENDGFESSTARLLTDAFTDVGTKIELAASQTETGKQELLVEVGGIRDYGHLSAIKTQLGNLLKDTGTLEERRISRGKVVFAVATKKSADDVRKQLTGVNLETAPGAPAPSLEVR